MVQGHCQITKEQILDVLSEEQLFKHYCKNFEKIDVSFKSEFRDEDKPSCRVTDLGGYLLYKDFGSSDPGTNIWGYLKKKYGCSYSDTFDLVAADFGLKSGVVNTLSSVDSTTDLRRIESHKRTIIKIKVRPWMLNDKNYWYEKYGIGKELLEEYGVRPVSHFWINDNIFYATESSYCYDYYYHEGRLLRKIYQPLSKYKWYSNIDNTVVQGIANIPKVNDLLIITKSLKDVICLRLLGYYAVAPNNEVSWIPNTVWNKFRERYKQIFIFFDNDTTGTMNAQIFSNQYGIPYFYLPVEDNVKDISDYIAKYRDIGKAKQLMLNLL